MRPPSFSGFVLAALTLALFSYVVGLGGGPSGLQSIPCEDEYVLSGLDKLTYDEEELRPRPEGVLRGDFLVETAVRRMEADRWSAVDVLGYGVQKEETPSSEKFLVVAFKGEPHRFRIPIASDDLAAGRYWAKTDNHVWTLLLPDGSTDNLRPLSEE